ncbi:MalY/PatB family protein [Aeromicrobium sp. CF3.5]|uniref:MalY/PatB family protein n=1 Tax=Aeromicrobium sp. CF3.5 TaxID=3373078 RepID=UPI003EE7A1D3
MRPLRDIDVDRLRERTSVKWAGVGPDILPLWVAEMDAHPIPAVVEAVESALRSGNTGYPSSPDAYANAFASFAADEWGWQVDTGRVAMVADVMTGVVEAIALVTQPGGTVIVNPPVYPPFFGSTEHAGRRTFDAPLGSDGRLDLDSIEHAYRVAPRDRGIVHLLCSPHNPTSVVHTREELTAVAALANQHGVTVVVDEIHAPLVADGFVPYLSVSGSDDAMVATSAAKGFNLAGFKAGLLIAGPDAPLENLHEMVSHGPGHLGMIAHTAALTDGRDWLRDLRIDLAENRRQLADGIASLDGISWIQHPGTYLAWLEFADLGDDPAAALLDRAGLMVNPGRPFGAGGQGHARLNYATSNEVLDEALQRLARLE